MSEMADIELRTLLPVELQHMRDVLQSETVKQEAAELPGVAWKVAGEKTENAVREALHGGLYELLANAWRTARELHEFKDETKHPAKEKSVVFLGKHELSTSVHPELYLTVAGHKLPPLKLTLEISAKVQAVALTVQRGHILQVGGGDCVVSAQLKCGEVPLHDEIKTTPAPLPGTVTLAGDGVSIL